MLSAHETSSHMYLWICIWHVFFVISHHHHFYLWPDDFSILGEQATPSAMITPETCKMKVADYMSKSKVCFKDDSTRFSVLFQILNASFVSICSCIYFKIERQHFPYKMILFNNVVFLFVSFFWVKPQLMYVLIKVYINNVQYVILHYYVLVARIFYKKKQQL